MSQQLKLDAELGSQNDNCPIDDTVGGRLRKTRMDRGFYSQSAFVKKYKLVQSTFSLHECNQRKVDVKTAHHYAKLLDVPVEYLLFGSRPMAEVDTDTVSWMSPEHHLCAGEWVSPTAPSNHLTRSEHLLPPDVRYPAKFQHAFVMADRTGGAEVPENAVVVTLDVRGSLHTLPRGSYVVLQRFAAGKRKCERTLRRVIGCDDTHIRLALPVPSAQLSEKDLQDALVPLGGDDDMHILGKVISIHSFI